MRFFSGKRPHAFHYSRNPNNKYAKYGFKSNQKGWEGGFGKRILGENWVNHHGASGKEGTRGLINGLEVSRAFAPISLTARVRNQTTVELNWTVKENIDFYEGTTTVNYDSTSKTENTRVAYPVNFIDNAKPVSIGAAPKNIFFLTADAFGVLPPISRLDAGQAMYHFISGYTAKVAGTEAGITEPQTTFSACFGKVFLPLHPAKYAEMLGKKMKENKVNVWLVNTGWSGGAYGVGSRMKLSYTRAMITAALNGELDGVQYEIHPVFGLQMPVTCPNVPVEILNPRNTWSDKALYDTKANDLAGKFVKNFEQYAEGASAEILAAAPKVAQNA